MHGAPPSCRAPRAPRRTSPLSPGAPQEDERLLRKLLGKVKVQADTDATAAAHHAAADEAALRAIVAKYKMGDDDIKAIVAWKHAHHVRGRWRVSCCWAEVA